MIQINSTILRHFEQKGLNINEGVAIDARLVKSASRPVSNQKLKELRDKKGNPKKFCRDPPKADWTIKNDTPHYGLKESAGGELMSTMDLSWPPP
jgi:IS5 family transposase